MHDTKFGASNILLSAYYKYLKEQIEGNKIPVLLTMTKLYGFIESKYVFWTL